MEHVRFKAAGGDALIVGGLAGGPRVVGQAFLGPLSVLPGSDVSSDASTRVTQGFGFRHRRGWSVSSGSGAGAGVTGVVATAVGGTASFPFGWTKRSPLSWWATMGCVGPRHVVSLPSAAPGRSIGSRPDPEGGDPSPRPVDADPPPRWRAWTADTREATPSRWN